MNYINPIISETLNQISYLIEKIQLTKCFSDESNIDCLVMLNVNIFIG